ncbi:hypothetical protein COBT_002192 [Conglomerata obtusa]
MIMFGELKRLLQPPNGLYEPYTYTDEMNESRETIIDMHASKLNKNPNINMTNNNLFSAKEITFAKIVKIVVYYLVASPIYLTAFNFILFTIFIFLTENSRIDIYNMLFWIIMIIIFNVANIIMYVFYNKDRLNRLGCIVMIVICNVALFIDIAYMIIPYMNSKGIGTKIEQPKNT